MTDPSGNLCVFVFYCFFTYLFFGGDPLFLEGGVKEKPNTPMMFVIFGSLFFVCFFWGEGGKQQKDKPN